jgi:dihydroorotate dehydrogenase (fumarate)/dihydroorotate dehydrogenase
MGLYRHVLRPVLFCASPEWIHNRAIGAASILGKSKSLCRVAFAMNSTKDPRLAVDIAGVKFANPIGLAAGFDKSGRAVSWLSSLGFGHIEIGSISAEVSYGNPKPRLFRIPRDRGIVVNYGLPNDGCERIADRLANTRRLPVPLGINVVNTNRGPNAPADSEDQILADYVRTVRGLRDHADYFSLNLSCPNTKDGRGFFTDVSRLRRLLEMMGELSLSQPVFMKVSGFPGVAEMEQFLQTVDPAPFIAGFGINLAPGKPPGLMTPAEKLTRMPGAVSGAPCASATDRLIRELYSRMDRTRHRIIGTGGVFTASDAYRKIRLGASLVQLLTALVYEGPGVVRRINLGLGELLEQDGFRHVSEAVGVDSARPERLTCQADESKDLAAK